ncbi:hypothetical protein FRZ67_03265 [Panacibacter ginsenosidivorans]|uniref:Uncharacterized protein n=1 Tax=Panacibacter ginsenosidivorans TaxID=1813871 RepID=A0A5B8V4C1_9BACT|nr:hypothetical protein [Panacibacter ginsenosidivorans]QEC66367.1 hypothetical protein FRZ67_03265 [Panacibacter ginsenosidivorans]
MMQQEYRIVIKNERYDQVRLLQVIFLAVMSIVFIVAAYYENNIFAFIWPMLLCFTIFIALNQQDFTRYKLFSFKNFLESGFVWTIIGSMLLLTWWITLLVIIIAVMQSLVKKQYEVILDRQAIQINAKPPKNIEWQALQNIVIKDELLTIDYKNNKIFQAEIIPALSIIGSEADFNDFCRLQLGAH